MVINYIYIRIHIFFQGNASNMLVNIIHFIYVYTVNEIFEVCCNFIELQIHFHERIIV